ncbi:hypothetical protein, partial [Mycobacterium asiaticum]
AARLARDVHHVETVDRVPASQHYVADAPREEAVSTDALTTPRAQAVPATEAAPRRGGLFRRHRTPVAHQ